MFPTPLLEIVFLKKETQNILTMNAAGGILALMCAGEPESEGKVSEAEPELAEETAVREAGTGEGKPQQKELVGV